MNKKNKIIIILALIIAALLAAGIFAFGYSVKQKKQTVDEAVEVLKENKKQEKADKAEEEKEEDATVTAAAGDAGMEFEDVEENVYIVDDSANLKTQPSDDAETAETVSKSTLIKRTGTSDEWSRLSRNGHTYYVRNESVSTEMPDGATSGDNVESDVDDSDTSDDSSTATETSTGGKIIIIDPGHQAQGDNTQEAIGPGSSQTKARVSSGTSGVVSGLDEYQLNLIVSLQLRNELEDRGYTVYMTRETHDVDMSNKERAEFATEKNGDILVRIHANGSDDSSVSGALCMAPSSSNTFLSSDLISQSQNLSQKIIDAYCASTGFNNIGVYQTDEMSGINWSTMPVTIVEMGYMSNASDDANMADSDMEKKMVDGIANGIDAYFAS